MNVRRIAKWTIGILLTLSVVAFLAFLYLIPPFTLLPPEAFIGPETAAAPSMASIADPKTRALAERGRYIVMITGCADCHTPPGANGPDWARYMGGGLKTSVKDQGTFVSANITPHPQFGLGRRSDEDVLRVLRSGVSADGGRQLWYRDMPWAWFANWTEEDRRAVVVYLRNIAPVAHEIPAPTTTSSVTYDPAAIEEGSAVDAGVTPGGTN